MCTLRLRPTSIHTPLENFTQAPARSPYKPLAEKLRDWHAKGLGAGASSSAAAAAKGGSGRLSMGGGGLPNYLPKYTEGKVRGSKPQLSSNCRGKAACKRQST